MDPLAALHLQLRLEGKEVSRGLIRKVENVPGEDISLLLIAQFGDGRCISYYDEVISPVLQHELAEGLVTVEFPHIDPLLHILERNNIRYEVGHYRTYLFPALAAEDTTVRCFLQDDPKVKDFGFDGLAGQVFAIECNDRLVSGCVSTRENNACGEAWVYTVPEFRHQGFAQKVVNAWARNLMKAGKVPFYSHKWENVASANLARKLGLQPIFEEIAITQASGR